MSGTPAAYGGGALLVLAGELPEPGLLADLRRGHGILVAADGVATRLLEQGLLPDLVIGDLDSITATPEHFAELGVRVLHDPSQETNDLEKALGWLLDNRWKSVTVVGASGGMTDHTLNNYSVLARFAPLMRISIYEERCSGYLLHDTIELTVCSGDRISIIPLPEATLTTRGLQWELDNERLAFGAREGASNAASCEAISIAVTSGTVLVMHYDSSRPE